MVTEPDEAAEVVEVPETDIDTEARLTPAEAIAPSSSASTRTTRSRRGGT
jgi:hypothetical protein